MATSFQAKTYSSDKAPTKLQSRITVLFARNGALLNETILDTTAAKQLTTLLSEKSKQPAVSTNIALAVGKSSTLAQHLILDLGSTKLDRQQLKTAFALLAKTLANMKNSTINEVLLSLDDISDLFKELDLKDIAALLRIEFDREAYCYTSTFSKSPAKNTIKKVTALSSSAKQVSLTKKGLHQGEAIAEGVNLARELGNLPGNHCTPSILANIARDMGKAHSNLNIKVLGLKTLERLKMGSFLSVAQGSAEEPKFIIFEYKGKTNSKPHVLVGKGITFDTGGISLKPGAGMDEMKFDMCGAASVFGTMKTLASLNANVHVVAVVAAAENMPSSTATKPGDVVTSMSGQTIEILNTDAEGRLVLCDALTYVERYKPKSVVDIATLTGACVVALGSHATGLFSNNQNLADKLLKAGESVGDRAWQMPLWDDYQTSLKSNFADMANIGGREAGSVTAACFLSRYAKKYPWAHLDIAGSAWKSGAAKGATGRPVEQLVAYLTEYAL